MQLHSLMFLDNLHIMFLDNLHTLKMISGLHLQTLSQITLYFSTMSRLSKQPKMYFPKENVHCSLKLICNFNHLVHRQFYQAKSWRTATCNCQSQGHSLRPRICLLENSDEPISLSYSRCGSVSFLSDFIKFLPTESGEPFIEVFKR